MFVLNVCSPDNTSCMFFFFKLTYLLHKKGSFRNSEIVLLYVHEQDHYDEHECHCYESDSPH